MSNLLPQPPDDIEKTVTESFHINSKNQYESILNTQKEMICRFLPDTTLIYVNDSYCKTFGKTKQELLGMKFLDLVPTESHHKILNHLDQLKKTHIPIVYEHHVITVNNEVRWQEWTDYLIISEAGTILFQSVGKDITNRKIDEYYLTDAKQKLESIFNELSDVIWSVSYPDYKLIFITPSVEKLYGITVDEWKLDSSWWIKIIHPDDKHVIDKIYSALVETGSIEIEYRVFHRSGRIKWIRSKIKNIKDESGNTVRTDGYTTDITKEKEYEIAHIQAKQEAIKASLAKSEFLANMSHEIRTPLNSVLGFSELLLETNLDSVQTEYIQVICQSGQLLLGIINDILDFSKIEAGKMDLSPERINLHKLVLQVADIIKFKTEEKNLELIIYIHPELPVYAVLDSLRLRQILLNLLSNAVKFTKQGFIEISVSSNPINDSDKFHNILFSVKDSGVGIPAEKQKTIFEAFTQEDSSTTRKYGGTGLGLAISNKLLLLMNSKLELRSSSGLGSIFYFSIQTEIDLTSNLSKPVSCLSYPQTKENKEESLVEKYFKILIVDDNQINIQLVKKFLNRTFPKFELLEAYNGQTAIESYKKNQPDLIFMDIQMPDISGYETTVEIRKMEQSDVRIPIIALTAGAKVEDRELCIEAGMDDYLTKPIDSKKLKYTIYRWLK